ncbi:MAG: serine/threonine-protein kinase PknK, partial [SAR324 cluster bacterium]|nr:serine/threonine-protein kinase PknK [SAR324 cluster bacterium]
MLQVKGYKVMEELYSGVNTTVCRAVRESDHLAVIIKYLNSEYPTQEELARFQHEHSILTHLQMPGISRVIGLERTGSSVMLVTSDDMLSKSLKHVLGEQTLKLEDILDTMLKLTVILGNVHKKGYIHRDLKPHNVIINPGNKEVTLIDFGIATTLEETEEVVASDAVLEGTLAYISPEQTGRMNRKIDFRSDLYSLGMTFYEVLAGDLPFHADDAMGWVHCHIARNPTPLLEKKPQIPGMIAHMIHKLLSKSVEDRYQSAFGLKHDLENCIRQFRETGKIEPFTLGTHDISDRLHIPQVLYGREPELNELMNLFELVKGGHKQMVFLGGQSGSGKSALVHELEKILVDHSGMLLSGKYDEFKRNDPYYGIGQAINNLVQNLLREDEDHLNQWKFKLAEALGPNGRIITDLAPDLELILGPQQPVPELGPSETQNRFQLTFLKFIRVFTQAHHPLVLFLDDLQFSDTASLGLLNIMTQDSELRHFMLILAYRDNEIQEDHPFLQLLQETKQGTIPYREIQLNPLNLEAIVQMLGETVKTEPENVKQLAEVIQNKTGGNTFFIHEFLKLLHHEKLLWFDFEAMCWKWDLDKIKAHETTGNVVELMIEKIQKLPEVTQSALKMAACIGADFNLKTLAAVCGRTLKQTADDLWSAVQEGMILPVGEGHKLLKNSEESGISDFKASVWDKFVHGRVQKAAYEMISDEDRKPIHLNIGRVLLKSLSQEELEEKLFYVTSQLNMGKNLIESQEEKNKLAELNLLSAQKARLSTAYGPAAGHARIGIELLSANCWIENYPLTLGLYGEAVDTSNLTRKFDKMNTYADIVLKNAKTSLDKVRVYEARLQSLVSQNKIHDGVRVALEALKMLGIKLPSRPNQLQVALRLLPMLIRVLPISLAKFESMPMMKNPVALAATRIIAQSVSSAYIVSANLFAIMLLKVDSLSLKHGITGVSPYGVG